MLNRLLIREATGKDVEKIADLLTDLLEIVEDLNGFDQEKTNKNIMYAINDPNSFILVAQTGNTLVGFIHVSCRRTIFHDGLSGLIDEIDVGNEFQGKFVGRKLAMAAIEKCK